MNELKILLSINVLTHVEAWLKRVFAYVRVCSQVHVHRAENSNLVRRKHEFLRCFREKQSWKCLDKSAEEASAGLVGWGGDPGSDPQGGGAALRSLTRLLQAGRRS